MFSQFAAQTTRRTVQRTTLVTTPKKFFSVTGQFAKDESALELDYIHKEERHLLQGLQDLQKKKQVLDHAAQAKLLSETLVKNKVEPTPKLVQDLMTWRLSQ